MQAISVSEARQNFKKYCDDVVIYCKGHYKE